jgi:hypothetical protein
MWDEQERFARTVLNSLAGLIAAVGLVILALGLYAGSRDVFIGYLTFLSLLAGLGLAYVATVGVLAHDAAGLVRAAGFLITRFLFELPSRRDDDQ